MRRLTSALMSAVSADLFFFDFACKFADFTLYEAIDELRQVLIQPFPQHGSEQLLDDVFQGFIGVAQRQTA